MNKSADRNLETSPGGTDIDIHEAVVGHPTLIKPRRKKDRQVTMNHVPPTRTGRCWVSGIMSILLHNNVLYKYSKQDRRRGRGGREDTVNESIPTGAHFVGASYIGYAMYYLMSSTWKGGGAGEGRK